MTPELYIIAVAFILAVGAYFVKIIKIKLQEDKSEELEYPEWMERDIDEMYDTKD